MTKRLQNPERDDALYKPIVVHKRLFLGFQPPTSSTLYCPNQFFDICIPHRSRGCVRLVGYILRRTLGWSDENGNPLEEQVVISYKDLIENAGISRDMIRSAIDEAIQHGFIICIREGRAKGPGLNAINALYEIRWDEGVNYIKEPMAFQGFYAHEGNRTYIPNQFFDNVLRTESLSVVKVVASVIRFSIGFQTKQGFRRKQVQLSYNHIQRYANITGRSTIATAIRTALERNYIVRIQEGLFTHDTSKQVTTTYSLKWSDNKHLHDISQIIVPDENKLDSHLGQKTVPGKTVDERSDNRTRNGQKKRPGKRSENRTSIEITTRNNISKQQQHTSGNSVVVDTELISVLQEQGFSQRDSSKLVDAHPDEVIQQQIIWLPRRNPGKNPTGLLRKAIEENWNEPPAADINLPTFERGKIFAAHFYAGLGGNDGKPIVEPTAKDSEIAEKFVEKLLKLWSDESRIPEWGRDFGKTVAIEANGKSGLEPGLNYALNSSRFGENFYRQIASERARNLRKENNGRREAHHRSYAKAFITFLNSEASRIKKDDPQRFEAFEKWRSEEKEKISTWRHLSAEALARHRVEFDVPKNKHTQFIAFFKYDFWKWDQEINPNTFSTGDQAA